MLDLDVLDLFCRLLDEVLALELESLLLVLSLSEEPDVLLLLVDDSLLLGYLSESEEGSDLVALRFLIIFRSSDAFLFMLRDTADFLPSILPRLSRDTASA